MNECRQAESLLAAVVARANSQFGMRTNDQEMVSDMYIERKFNISLDHHSTLFQCMHKTDSAPLPTCDPWKHMKERDGTWYNDMTKTVPSVFHFNGGGKAHHLAMEGRTWYKQRASTESEKAQVYNTQLRMGDSMRSFREICPNHLDGGGQRSGRSPRGRG